MDRSRRAIEPHADKGSLMLDVVTVATLGFLLGMRHATDADHVIAVSTIVSRQRSIRSAGLIGMFWGFGHTVTILSVGAAIILFNTTIPPLAGARDVQFGSKATAACGLISVAFGLCSHLQNLLCRRSPCRPHTLKANRVDLCTRRRSAEAGQTSPTAIPSDD